MSKTDLSRRQFLLSSLMGLGAVAAAGASGVTAGAGGEESNFPSPEAALKEAWRLVEEEGVCRVVVRGSSIVSVERGRGVGPLVRLLDARPQLLKGSVVVESVVGRAAAAIAVQGGVARVLARTASEGARDVLSAAQVPLEAKVVVPHIMNRDLTGICPIEAATEGFNSPADIVAAARRTLDTLRAKAKEATA